MYVNAPCFLAAPLRKAWQIVVIANLFVLDCSGSMAGSSRGCRSPLSKELNSKYTL